MFFNQPERAKSDKGTERQKEKQQIVHVPKAGNGEIGNQVHRRQQVDKRERENGLRPNRNSGIL
jgi:hypothetical protein